MAKKEKSPKFNSVEDAKALIADQKEIRSAAKEERKAYAKEHGLSIKEDHADNKKHGKKWAQFTSAIDNANAQIEAAEAWIKENKPKGKGGNFASKYTYPEDIVTPEDKKKYRTRMRAAAAAAEKAAAKGEAKGDSKKSKKSKKAAEEEADDDSED